jgi:hypothetical protein
VFVLRCTKKLLKRTAPSVPAKDELPTSTTRLGDWYANLVIVRRQHFALAVSGVTLLPVLLPAAPFKTLPARIAVAVAEVLDALQIDYVKAAAEITAMKEFAVAATNNRQVLGSMNDFAKPLDFYLGEGTTLDAAIKLAETPCSPLGMETPKMATRALFGRPDLRSVKR